MECARPLAGPAGPAGPDQPVEPVGPVAAVNGGNEPARTPPRYMLKGSGRTFFRARSGRDVFTLLRLLITSVFKLIGRGR